jgi:ABC-type lipoprotein export system ATPase subunit
MVLTITQLLPIPLKERLQSRSSEVWQQTVSLQQGEKLFIQAPSGTGKTTLAHILYGIRRDYEGSVLWDDKSLGSINNEQLAELRKKQISIVFQDLRIFPELTAWENLELKRSLTNTITAEEVTEWMARLGMTERKNSMGGTLSYGERQRIAIIRALLQPFEWLIMDEPFSHLDKANIQKASTLIDEVAARNKASILLADLDDNRYFDYSKTLHL